ncbi:MAG: Nif3-like dinuclear metal center hexameric protein [Planctomycetaceae bacterium]|nr:Nif3-like dinuclear metal center hexameric protein [Planctomycetaceae bacterium]
MNVRDVAAALETLAPPHLAAEWDNTGLLLGDRAAPVRRVMLCIDLTGEVLDEAAAARAEMVMAYHPLIFKPISRVTAQEHAVAWRAARTGLAVYCPHTALDVAAGGTNDALAAVMGLQGPQPLEPQDSAANSKIVVFVHPENLDAVSRAAFAAGAGRIGSYSECSFHGSGMGTFRGAAGTSPAVGKSGRLEEVHELRLEVLAPRGAAGEIVSAIRAAHSYEEPAIDIYPLDPLPDGQGMGRVGDLPRAMTALGLIARIKKAISLAAVQVAGPRRQRVVRAACCAGSCGTIWRAALSAGANFYLTGEMHHHDALAAAAANMTVVCVGHSNSERPVLPLLRKNLLKLLPALKVTISRRDKDPFTQM